MSLFQVDAGKEWRGGQRQSLYLAQALQTKRYPFLYCVQPDSPLARKARETNLPLLPLRIRSEADPLAVLRLAVAMKRRQCRLVHAHDAHSAAICAGAAALAKVPIRVLSRRVDFPLQDNVFSRMKYRRNIDAVIAISRGVKDVLVKGGIDPEIIHVIPSGIDFGPFEKADRSGYLRKELSFEAEDFLVGIVAHLADHKGHRYLIKAARILKEKAPRIKLIIVGEGPLRLELDKLASEIEVDDMVFFLGFREDVPQILASLDLFVLSSYLEGMGSSLLDAMASRLPIVATRVGGIPEVVIQGETGLLVPPRRPDSLAKAILTLYKDRKLAEKLGRAGYDLVHAEFSAQAMADRIIDVYKGLAKAKGIPLVSGGSWSK